LSTWTGFIATLGLPPSKNSPLTSCPTSKSFTPTTRSYAALAKARLSIGVVDTLIAATAISQRLILINGNTKHFSGVQAAGFPLTLENWREP
jgi:tRNA(fMet)-specific endonuclease VapC